MFADTKTIILFMLLHFGCFTKIIRKVYIPVCTHPFNYYSHKENLSWKIQLRYQNQLLSKYRHQIQEI